MSKNCSPLNAERKSKMFFNSKSSDLKSVDRTLKLLSDFHAVPLDNPQFLKKYGQLVKLRNLLFIRKGKFGEN